jgi:hypothetical protein
MERHSWRWPPPLCRRQRRCYWTLRGTGGVLPDQEKVLYTCTKVVRCSILSQYRYIVKGLGGLMPLFFTLLAFLSYIQYIHTLNIRRGSSPFPHRWTAQRQKPPWGAESGFELGPALQRADVLPTDTCRTLIVTHGTNFSHMMPISSHSLLYYTVRVQYRVYK